MAEFDIAELAKEIERGCNLVANEQSCFRAAQKIDSIFEDKQPIRRLGKKLIVNAFVNLMTSPGYGELDESDQEVLQHYMVTYLNCFLDIREGLVGDTAHFLNKLKTGHQLPPNLVSTAELTAQRTLFRSLTTRFVK